MNGQIIFLTAFLGVVAGSNHVSLQVSGPIKTVNLLLDGREIAFLTKPPWQTTIELGSELTPRELTAVGFDAEGHEVTRATQVLNLPRPVAEFDIALEREGDAPPSGAALRWHHLTNTPPAEAKLTLDGKSLSLDDKLHARLPKLDLEMPHVLAAEIRFADGLLARRELVIESVRSDSVGTQLTPIAVRETAKRHPASWSGCLAAPDGKPVRTAAVEKPRAVVIVVREPDVREARAVITSAQQSLMRSLALGSVAALDKGTVQRMLWPIAEQHTSGQEMTVLLFPPSSDVDSGKLGMLQFVLSAQGPPVEDSTPRRFADAVVVAGLSAVTGAQRRAVVLVLSRQPDASLHDPGAVRRYLEAIGVPLFVWSPFARKPNGAAAWGEVDDVSTVKGFTEATDKLRRVLDEQRIAWVDVDPLTAMRLKSDRQCGIEK